MSKLFFLDRKGGPAGPSSQNPGGLASAPAVLVARLVVGGVAGVVGAVMALIGHAQARLAIALSGFVAIFVVLAFGARPGVGALDGLGIGGRRGHQGE